MVGGNSAFNVIIDEGKCDCCGECTISCSTDALYINEGKIVHDIEICAECERCVIKCLNDAIEVKRE